MRRTASHTGQVNGDNVEASSPTVRNLRRTSSTAHGSSGDTKRAKPNFLDQWKNLGPSNPANRPKQTRYNTVKIKPGMGTLSDNLNKTADNTPRPSVAAQGGVGAGLVNSAGRDAKDGALAVATGYGSIHSGSPPSPKKHRKGSLVVPSSADGDRARPRGLSSEEGRPRSEQRSRATSQSTLGSMHSGMKSPALKTRGRARSGSITEQIVDAGGIKKTVLEMTSSSDDVDQEDGGARVQGGSGGPSNGDGGETKENDRPEGGGKKKRRRKRRGGKGGGTGEETPLLGDGH